MNLAGTITRYVRHPTKPFVWIVTIDGKPIDWWGVPSRATGK